MISIQDFAQMELKVAVIKEVNDHPDADRLYVMKINCGEEEDRQLVAGIKKGYTKEELTGKKIIIVANLQPAVIRGVESQGMLLAASDDETIALLSPEREVKLGSKVK